MAPSKKSSPSIANEFKEMARDLIADAFEPELMLRAIGFVINSSDGAGASLAVIDALVKELGALEPGP